MHWQVRHLHVPRLAIPPRLISPLALRGMKSLGGPPSAPPRRGLRSIVRSHSSTSRLRTQCVGPSLLPAAPSPNATQSECYRLPPRIGQPRHCSQIPSILAEPVPPGL